jgi:hypothetical protein
MRPTFLIAIVTVMIGGMAWRLDTAPKQSPPDLFYAESTVEKSSSATASATPAPGTPVFDPALNLSPAMVSILQRSCVDCHSDGTRWPWYAHLPPASWMMNRDVTRGRRAMNLSQWSAKNGRTPGSAIATFTAVCNNVKKGRMPRSSYLLLHREARLRPQDIDDVCAWTDREITALKSRDASRSPAIAGENSAGGGEK